MPSEGTDSKFKVRHERNLTWKVHEQFEVNKMYRLLRCHFLCGYEPWLTPVGEIVHVLIYVVYCMEDIFTSGSMYPEQLFPQSLLWAFSHSDSLAVKTLLTSTVSIKLLLALTTLSGCCALRIYSKTKMPQLLSPSVSFLTERFMPVTDSGAQQGQLPDPLKWCRRRIGARQFNRQH